MAADRLRRAGGRNTSYLPPDRTTPAELAREIEKAARSPLLTALLDANGSAAAVLDRNRQTVALNAEYLKLAGVEDPSAALGLRPGEAVGCTHHRDGPGGCGTGRACASCGAAVALLIAAHRGRPAERICSLARQGGDLQLRARVTPVDVEGEPFLLIAIRDVTAEYRRAAFAQSFLHDLANTAVGLQSASAHLDGPHRDPSAAEDIRFLSEFLVREVAVQRALSEEGGSSNVRSLPRRVDVPRLLAWLRRTVEHHPAAAGRRMELPLADARTPLSTDPHLLQHVLQNMAINALEATPRGGAIRVEVEERPGGVAFRVWNAGAIPAAVVPRIFQRYFSTKPGPHRGQGTYAMKLFGEELLHGRVTFTTSAADGTWFEISLPVAEAAPAAR